MPTGCAPSLDNLVTVREVLATERTHRPPARQPG